MTKPIGPVAAAFAAFPQDAQARLAEIRQLIFDVANAEGVGPLTETLKWGQPSYLTEATKAGTTVRLGQPDEATVALYVHCQTTLVDQYRERYADTLAFDGNRAVVIPIKGPLPADALAGAIALALTYHRTKRENA